LSKLHSNQSVTCGMDSQEYYEKYTKPMELPTGNTCVNCQHFKATCKWLLSFKGNETSCSWSPSRFVPLVTKRRNSNE